MKKQTLAVFLIVVITALGLGMYYLLQPLHSSEFVKNSLEQENPVVFKYEFIAIRKNYLEANRSQVKEMVQTFIQDQEVSTTLQ